VKQLFALACLVLASCTPGGTPSNTSSAAQSSVVTIDVNLTLNKPTNIPQGSSGGYSPALTTVSVGTAIRFVNSDSFAHTAGSLGTMTTFPAASPLTAASVQQTGTALSQQWSTGELQPGQASQTLIADKAGTYLYGCFFHYGSPMRAAIVVQ
jgi:plastocyanin